MANMMQFQIRSLEDLPPPSQWAVEYDEETDTLYMNVLDPRPSTSIDLDGEVWARLDPTTGEIVGFEIEGFRSVFLVRHPEIPRPTMKAIQPAIEKEGWLPAFVAFLKKMCGMDGHNGGGHFVPA